MTIIVLSSILPVGSEYEINNDTYSQNYVRLNDVDDAENTTWVVGNTFFGQSKAVGGWSVNTEGWSDAFLVGLNESGEVKSLSKIGSDGEDYFSQLIKNSDSGWVILGSFSSAPTSIISKDNQSMGLILFLDRNMSPINSISIESYESIRFNDLEILQDGEMIVAGNFEGTLNLEDRNIESDGGADGFMMRLTSLGEIIWFEQIKGSGSSSVDSLSIVDDECAMIGNFNGLVKFGLISQYTQANTDSFLSIFDCDTGATEPLFFGGADVDQRVYFNDFTKLSDDRGWIVVGKFTGLINNGSEFERNGNYGDMLIEIISNIGVVTGIVTAGVNESSDATATAIFNADSDGLFVMANWVGIINISNQQLVSDGLNASSLILNVDDLLNPRVVLTKNISDIHQIHRFKDGTMLILGSEQYSEAEMGGPTPDAIVMYTNNNWTETGFTRITQQVQSEPSALVLIDSSIPNVPAEFVVQENQYSEDDGFQKKEMSFIPSISTWFIFVILLGAAFFTISRRYRTQAN